MKRRIAKKVVKACIAGHERHRPETFAAAVENLWRGTRPFRKAVVQVYDFMRGMRVEYKPQETPLSRSVERRLAIQRWPIRKVPLCEDE